MTRLIAAVLLTAVASAAFAYQDTILVEEGATPPKGYALLVPSFEWKDGRFVRNGDVYKNLHGGN